MRSGAAERRRMTVNNSELVDNVEAFGEKQSSQETVEVEAEGNG